MKPVRKRQQQKPGQDPVSEIELVEIASLTPAKLNDEVYNPISPDDPDIVRDAGRLKETIGRFGIRGIDALHITLDGVIVSGHRRRAMLLYLGETHAPVKRLPIRSTDPDFSKFLVGYNGNRDKDPAVLVREQMVLADPNAAWQTVQTARAEKARIKAVPLQLDARRRRCRISKAKEPFLDAVFRVLKELEAYLPVSDRRIHYVLLNDPPLRHARKPETYTDKKGRVRHNRYRNDLVSYKALCDLLTRARIAGRIPFEWIGDETRPVTSWSVHPNVSPFVAESLSGFLDGYWRDLMIGQENHIEIVGEKMTIEGTIRPVAAKFTIPYTIGRGYSSLPPRKAMFDRYRASKKKGLVILFLADLDPEGMDIPDSFGKSMRDDFGIPAVEAVRVGLKPEQTTRLPQSIEAKEKSSRYKKFAAKYGRYAYELDAVPPDHLQRWLEEAITTVIDVDTFNEQVAREKQDLKTLGVYRKEAMDYLTRMTAG